MENDENSTDTLSPITRDFAEINQHAAAFIKDVIDKLARENINLSPKLPEIR